ncbi:MAG: carboxylating nicotinate-nucleotide diphosphorylase [Gammaproteobacteria bacterium]
MSQVSEPPVPEAVIREAVERALSEDIGSGDRTAQLVPETARLEATVISREEAVLCGQAWFDAVFDILDPRSEVRWEVEDGQRVQPDQVLCRLGGPARSLLTGERTALNFLQTLSGIATLARRYADAVAGTGATVLDTRKTIPGLRVAQKYAVRCGGCRNHRMGLYDGILIKENHIAAAGSITEAVAAGRREAVGLPVEVEVENLGELREALAAGADILLLDNFTLEQLRAAVAINEGRARLEASGNVTLANLREIALTGVDYVSVGALTKDLHAVDLSLRYTNAPQMKVASIKG